MGVTNTGLNEAGIRNLFFERYRGMKSNWERFVTKDPSTKDSELYKFMAGPPMMREMGTGRLAKGFLVEGYRIGNLEYEATVEVDRKEVEDDQTGQIIAGVQDMADYAATHKDYLRAQLLENGGLAGALCYDNVPFFSTVHVSGASGSQSNDLGAAAADASAPNVAEMKVAIAAAVVKIRTIKDARGNPKALGRGGLVIEVPANMEIAALEAVNTATIAGTDNVMRGWADVEVNEWLNGTTQFYTHKIDRPVKPFIFQDRKKLEFAALDKPTDPDAFHRGKFYYGCLARYGMAYGRWEYCMRTTFAVPDPQA